MWLALALTTGLLGSGVAPAPAPTPFGGFEMGARQVSFKPLLQRILESRGEKVQPQAKTAKRKARTVVAQAADLVQEKAGQELERAFLLLMQQWTLIVQPAPGIDPAQLFMAQVAMRLRSEFERDEEEALLALMA